MQTSFLPIFLAASMVVACGSDSPSGALADESGGESADDTGASSPSEEDGAGLCEDDAADLVRPEGWGIDSHCKGAEPDYDRLFDDTKVQRIDLTISPEDYAAMRANLDEIVAANDWEEDPIYVPATVEYEDKSWWEVGVRYKGNSSLHSTAAMGLNKFALRLKFDEYEDANPDLMDQRFYGFKKMTFSNAFKDNSLIRDKLGGDIFRAAGLAVARSSFTRIYIDVGNGPEYWGLYTMTEDPSNKMLDTQFADGSGNLYKPDGVGAKLQSFDQSAMIKKTNEEDADFSDVQSLISILNSGSGEAWRSELEGVFDVSGFLTLLAVNQSIQNWDSYGWMTHNYYIYADPSDGLLKWIPWDLNESLIGHTMGGPGGGGSDTSASVLLDEIGADWPLIRRLLDDEVYNTDYREKLLSLQTSAFDLDTCVDLALTYHELIKPYVIGAEGEQPGYSFLNNDTDFENSINGGNDAIADHIASRHAALSAAL